VDVGGVALTRCAAIPFVHFNAALSLGLHAPATPAVIDAVIEAYRSAGVARFTVLCHLFSRPAELPDGLAARGFLRKPGWDRVYRLRPATDSPPGDEDVRFVTPETAADWTGFLDRWYGLPTSPWLAVLAGRPGWIHAVLVRDERIVAARSLYLQPGRSAWMGVEAPVPGLMTPGFEDDTRLARALLNEAARAGVEVCAADVEAPNDARTGPAYERWTALGFAVAYRRLHYVSPPA